MSKPTQESCLENEVEGSFKRNKYITEKKTVKQTNKQTNMFRGGGSSSESKIVVLSGK